VRLPDAPGVSLDLHCDLTERADGGVEGRLEYATELFDETTIIRFADDYVRLLDLVGAHPTRLPAGSPPDGDPPRRVRVPARARTS